MAAYSPSSSSSDGSEYHVAFRSPQQLRAFNAPYQLGRAPDAPDDTGLDDRPVPDDRFETPNDASKVCLPLTLLTTHSSLLTTHYPLLTTHSSLLTTQ